VNILVLGPQGSGKGTQANKVARTYGIPHIATGDMLREMRELSTPLGRELKEVLDSGELVNDELMIELIRDRLSRGDTIPGFILDGFPRTMAQAEALDDLLRDLDRSLDIVFEFQVPHREQLVERLLRRAQLENRADDTPDAIERRLAVRPRDGAARRVLPHDAGQRRRHPRRPDGRRGLPRDPGLAAVGRGARMIIRKSQAEIEGMARAGELVHETLQLCAEALEPGMSMLELDRIADEHIASKGGYPTSKGYKGFPAALCLSPNSMIVHGIPNEYRAQEGDLISVDLGITLDGLIADSAITVPIGEISDEAQRLLDTCQEALAAGIDQAQPGNRLSDISHAVQLVVEGAGFSVVRSLVGHGVGRHYHEDPQIPNYGPPGRGPLLQEGMTLAIEPMITAGRPEVYVHDDDWSISSVDESLAAHFEHTVAITAEGPRILTREKAALLR
jgi:methionyl aminopeptidase